MGMNWEETARLYPETHFGSEGARVSSPFAIASLSSFPTQKKKIRRPISGETIGEEEEEEEKHEMVFFFSL